MRNSIARIRAGHGRRHLALACALLLLALLSGCAGVGVQPWERDLLAQDAMAVDANPLTTAVDGHIYFSKEASTGGLGTGGGGCGCN
jgi:hypothetical protein